MLTIIIGLLLLGILCYLVHIKYNPKSFIAVSLIIFLPVCSFCLPIIGVFAPLQGYEETAWQKDIELISFKLDKEEKTTYVIESNV